MKLGKFNLTLNEAIALTQAIDASGDLDLRYVREQLDYIITDHYGGFDGLREVGYPKRPRKRAGEQAINQPFTVKVGGPAWEARALSTRRWTRSARAEI